MSAPYTILDCLPSLCQKLSDLVEIWRSYNKNYFACFFLADRTNGRAYATVLRLSVVCDIMYCGC